MKTILPLLFFGVLAGSCLVGAAGKLPAFTAERWVNSAPLTAAGLRGKVVLLDIWEYTCINWIRTLPYIKAWNRDYAALSLVVVGLHAPEFEFGKRAGNIDRGRPGVRVPPSARDGLALTIAAFTIRAPRLRPRPACVRDGRPRISALTSVRTLEACPRCTWRASGRQPPRS